MYDIARVCLHFILHPCTHAVVDQVHWPLEAPAATVARFAHIPDRNRQLVAAMASEMDTGVGEILGNLTAAGERVRTLVCFTSDKCAPCALAAVARGPSAEL